MSAIKSTAENSSMKKVKYDNQVSTDWKEI